MTFEQWAAAFPEAAAALNQVVSDTSASSSAAYESEAAAQQQARLSIARQGGLMWRNNVGATPAEDQHQCPKCQFKFKKKQQPIRYGLCNDSPQLNKKFKSSDLIGIIPRIIRPCDIGRTIGQFASIEVKRPGWSYSGRGRESAQANWLSLVESKGGLARFTTGAISINQY